MKKVWSMFMLLAVCLVACTNIDDLEDDVDALKKRVTALETQVRDINSNTEALRELYNEGTFITNIEEKSDSYTLTLSNGKTVNLYMKNDNNLLCPIIGIDSEGYCYTLEVFVFCRSRTVTGCADFVISSFFVYITIILSSVIANLPVAFAIYIKCRSLATLSISFHRLSVYSQTLRSFIFVVKNSPVAF